MDGEIEVFVTGHYTQRPGETIIKVDSRNGPCMILLRGDVGRTYVTKVSHDGHPVAIVLPAERAPVLAPEEATVLREFGQSVRFTGPSRSATKSKGDITK